MTREFWGTAGAGGLFYALSTGKVLIQKRSPYVNEPNTWGAWGGKIDADEDPAQALMREVHEESGYRGNPKLVPVHVFREGAFTYHNYLLVVPEEFEPRHSWESSEHMWVDINDLPQPLHFGLQEALPRFKRAVKRYGRRERTVRALQAAASVLARDMGRKDPKMFYVVVPIGDGAIRGDKDNTRDLSHGVLDGVQGISDTSGIIMQWYGIGRNAILAMDAKKLFALNKLSRIQYDNPEYLLSDGLAPLYRIWDKKPDGSVYEHGGVASNIVDHMVSGAGKAPTDGKSIRKDFTAARTALLQSAGDMQAAMSMLDEDAQSDVFRALGRIDSDDVASIALAVKRAENDDFKYFDSGYTDESLLQYLPSALLNFVDRYSPYVTRVDEWLADEKDARENADYYTKYYPNGPAAIDALVKALREFKAAILAFSALHTALETAKTTGKDRQGLAHSLRYSQTTLSRVFGEYLAQHRHDVKTVKGLAIRLHRLWSTHTDIPEHIKKHIQESPDTILSMVRSSLEKTGRIYKDEGEWLVKDHQLKVPKGSILYVSSPLPDEIAQKRADGTLDDFDRSRWYSAIEKHDEMGKTIEKHRLDTRYKIIRINDMKFDAAKKKWHLRKPKDVSAAFEDASRTLGELRKEISASLLDRLWRRVRHGPGSYAAIKEVAAQLSRTASTHEEHTEAATAHLFAMIKAEEDGLISESRQHGIARTQHWDRRTAIEKEELLERTRAVREELGPRADRAFLENRAGVNDLMTWLRRSGMTDENAQRRVTLAKELEKATKDARKESTDRDDRVADLRHKFSDIAGVDDSAERKLLREDMKLRKRAERLDRYLYGSAAHSETEGA